MLDLGLVEFEKFYMPEKIVGEKLTLLRRSSEHDIALFQMMDNSREFLSNFLFFIPTTKSVEDVSCVTEIFDNNWNEKNSFEYVFFANDTNELVGAGGVHTVSYMNRWAELGYFFAENSVGKGYGTEVIALLEKELFLKGIHRVQIQCDEENVASVKIAEKNAYKLEGTLKDAKLAFGKYHTQKLFAKINPKG